MSAGNIGESDLNGVMKSEYVFFAGERIARRDYPSGSVAYYFSDHLKTTSIVTDSAGVIKNESDYYPWGGEVQLIANDSNHYKFNGKERDETGLDYYGARYYSNKLGRFVTPDWAGNAVAVPYANFGNPQSLNLYAYVENNPTTLADVDGHLAGSPTSNSPPFDCWNSCLNGGIHYGEFCGLDFGPCPPPHYNPRIDGPDCKMCEEGGTQNQPDAPSGQKPSWKPGEPLPKDPGGLGPDWRKNPDHKNPNGEQWINDKTGEKVEFEPGRPGEKGWQGEDHRHYTPPGGKKGKEHIRPGEVGKLLVVIGQGVVQTMIVKPIREHPVATGAVVGAVAIGATVLTGGAAAPALALVP